MGNYHNEKIKLLKNYIDDMTALGDAHIKGDIPSKVIDNAIKYYASGCDRDTIIGLYDTSVLGNGKSGFVFTDDKVYYIDVLEKPKKFWYEDIEKLSICNAKKDKDSTLYVETCDDMITISCNMINKKPLKEFLSKMRNFDTEQAASAKAVAQGHISQDTMDYFQDLMKDYDYTSDQKKSTQKEKQMDAQENTQNQFSQGTMDYFQNLMKDYKPENKASSKKSQEDTAAQSAGMGLGTQRSVIQQGQQEKFHARQGHGFAAEQANNLYDNLTGHDAKIVGDDNAKNGADRIVDGVYIQSKYCATGRSCVNSCFENNGSGQFRYMQNGKPMQIEVPSDKYADAVSAMENKIKNGQVSGVTDPNEAKNIIRKGNFTYAQAKNIAKAGTVESLTYDAVNGAIIASSALGVSALISFATAFWNGEEIDVALKIAAYSGLKVGGTSFVSVVLAEQLSKAGLNKALVGASEAIANKLGPKAAHVLAKAFSQQASKELYGAAAMKFLAKCIRCNVIATGASFVVLTSFDVANIFRGRISGRQLFKNMVNTAASVGGGAGGMVAGAAAGSAIFPGVGTAIGAIVGGLAAGSAASKAANSVMDNFIEDDADEMVRIIQRVFEEMSSEYLLNEKEAEKSVDRLKDKLTGKLLKDMFACEYRTEFARNLLTPIIERVVSKRPRVQQLSSAQMLNGVRNALEEMSDCLSDDDLLFV